MDSLIAEYARAFHTGANAGGSAQKLMGRILHGKTSEHFATLTDKPGKRNRVMTMGADGLERLIGLDHLQMLRKVVGYKDEYVRRLVVDQQESFKLVVFGAEGHSAPLATWENVVRLVARECPELAEKFFAALPGLQSMTFLQLQEQAGFSIAEADREEHPCFMTAERLAAASGSPGEVRAYLYHTEHLRELFSGDGYTYTQEGERMVMEYMFPNKPLSELGDHIVIDLTVTLGGSM